MKVSKKNPQILIKQVFQIAKSGALYDVCEGLGALYEGFRVTRERYMKV
jgi:hypothetical protein